MAGEVLTSASVPVAFKKHNGGLNSTGSALSLQVNESPDLQNIDFNKFGSILKRSGYTALNTSAFNSGAAWTSLHWYELSAGTPTQYLIGTCGNKLAKMDALDGGWDDITGTLTITAGNNNLFTWRTFLDTALGTNGVDVPLQWTGTGNGSALTVPTGLTTAKWLEIFNSYVFLANVTVSGTVFQSRLYWSNLGSISTWTATDFANISPNDGQAITGLRTLGEELIIFKDRSIWKASFTGDADVPFTFVKTRSPVGCISGYSIQEIENGLFFLAADGYYYFDGNNSFKVSDRITTTLGTFASNRFLTSNSAYQRTKNRYWGSFTLSGDTTHTRCVTWDSFNNAFSLYKGHNANCYALVITSGDERLYFGDYSGFVYRADTGTNDSPANVATAINAYYYTKWFDYDDIVNIKATPHVYLYYQNNNATDTFAYAYDFESTDTYSLSFSTASGASVYGSAVYGTATYAGTGGAVRRIDLKGRGRVVRFKIANATAGEAFQIDGMGALPSLESMV